MSEIHDSGERQRFAGGAVRDTAYGKPRIDLISPFMLERLGHWMRLGAEKYSERNWENGIPNSRCFASLYRHVVAFHKGDCGEDHLAAIIFNAMAIIHNVEAARIGLLPKSLLDMPDYSTPRLNPAPVSDRIDTYDMLFEIARETEMVIREHDAGDENG